MVEFFSWQNNFNTRSMEKEKKHVVIYGTSKSMDANKLIAEMENEKEHRPKY